MVQKDHFWTFWGPVLVQGEIKHRMASERSVLAILANMARIDQNLPIRCLFPLWEPERTRNGPKGPYSALLGPFFTVPGGISIDLASLGQN